MARGVITERWSFAPGAGGLPLWSRTVVCTFDHDTLRTLRRNAHAPERVKFVPIPHRREVAAISLDGTDITAQTIRPTDYSRAITDTVKLAPAGAEIIAPEQPSGDWSGYAICRVIIQYQQLRDNHAP